MSAVSADIIKKNEDINTDTNKSNRTNKIQILLSEFGFSIIMGFIILLLYAIPKYHSKKIFTSKNIPNFNFSHEPIIFIHTTDIHSSTTKIERIDGSSIFLMSLCEYNPDLFLLTGDYVDNFKTGKSKRMGGQNLEDWKIYNTSIRNTLIKKGIKAIDVSGNHDQWAVDFVNSDENNFLGNSFIFNRTNVKNDSDFFFEKNKS